MRYYIFTISGYEPKPVPHKPVLEDLKTQARRWSHKVEECDDEVGPCLRFLERGKRVVERRLTRREVVFGATYGERRGGFTGLVNWIPEEEGETRVVCKVMNASLHKVGIEDWLVDFVRKIILAAGWKIEGEESVE